MTNMLIRGYVIVLAYKEILILMLVIEFIPIFIRATKNPAFFKVLTNFKLNHVAHAIFHFKY